MHPLTEIYLDRRRMKNDGTYPVKLKITLVKDRKYFKTPFNLAPSEFEEVRSPKPKKEFKEISMKLAAIEQKAANIIQELGEAFTFDSFERLFLKNRSFRDSLETAFETYMDDIRENQPDRVGSINVYERAKISFTKYAPKAKIGDVTVKFLQGYEAWMSKSGNSPTTTGIYCQHLRSIINTAISEGRLSKEVYPFGKAKDKKYEIPTAINTKKALSLSDIALIFNYGCEPGNEEMCRDYWIFIYLSNGLNVADLCRLQRKHMQGDRISFIREKTVRTKKVIEPIQIIVQDTVKVIIEKWGNSERGDENYIFPHLTSGMDEQTKHDTVHNLTWLINKHMGQVAKNAGISLDKAITTYHARHSFATIMQNSGAPIAMISKALGHSSIATTQKYLGSFETDQLKEATAVLTKFK